MIYLNYIVQVQDYPALFGQLHDVFLNHDVLFWRMTYHPMVTAVLGVSSASHLFGPFWLWKLNESFFRKIISILGKSE